MTKKILLLGIILSLIYTYGCKQISPKTIVESHPKTGIKSSQEIRIDSENSDDETLEEEITFNYSEANQALIENGRFDLMCEDSFLLHFSHKEFNSGDATKIYYVTDKSKSEIKSFYSTESSLKNVYFASFFSEGIFFDLPVTINIRQASDDSLYKNYVHLSFDDFYLKEDKSSIILDNMYNTLINDSAAYLCEKANSYNKYINSSKKRITYVNSYFMHALKSRTTNEYKDETIMDILNSIGFNNGKAILLESQNIKMNYPDYILRAEYAIGDNDPNEDISYENILGKYIGQYENVSGKMNLFIDIYEIKPDDQHGVAYAMVEFSPHPTNEKGKAGAYLTEGWVSISNGYISLEAVEWISPKPENYNMLGLEGFINDNRFSGSFIRDELREFDLIKADYE